MKFRLSNYFSFFLALLFIACSEVSEVDDEKLIDESLNAWHKAAAVADEDDFFGFMTEECIYLGTDITEKWKRDELREWSKKYFDRETAWAFTPLEREIYIQGNTAWFDEKLDTWMGDCKGSGVLTKTDEGWKLIHYDLSVAVPNEKIKGFIELVGN